MHLEEMQEYADAVETLEHYQRRTTVRIIGMIWRGIEWLIVGIFN